MSEIQAATHIQSAFRGYTVRKSNRGDCGICLENDRRSRLLTLCPLQPAQRIGGHAFHLACARNYYATTLTAKCPNCRTDLTNLEQARIALTALGSRHGHCVAPSMTVDQARGRYLDLLYTAPLNPTELQRSIISSAYHVMRMLEQNVASIA